MLCYEGRVSVYCFCGTIVPLVSLVFLDLVHIWNAVWGFPLWLFLSYFVFVNIVIKFLYKGNIYGIASRSVLLGCLFGAGINILCLLEDPVQIFGIYMSVMALFHYGEFLCMAYIQPKLVTVDSFVINHSMQYTIAALMSWCEFFVEAYFFPDLKALRWFSYVGLVMCVLGDGLRKLAMITAHSNFNHLVQYEKADDHVLVTHGVYSLFRHPSYVGWFYWSIGTQIILVNPLCIVGYTLASWFFFKERITIEELMLLGFFGQEYCDYQEKVCTGLPFIEGYKL